MVIKGKICDKAANGRKKYNIALVENSSGQGGSAKCVYQFAKYLNINKYNLYLFLRGKNGWYKKLIENRVKAISCFKFNPDSIVYSRKSKINYLIKIAQLLLMLPHFVYYFIKFAKYNIDLVHVNNNIFIHIPAIVASRLLNIPIICHLHDQNYLTILEKCFIRLITKFFVLSTSALKTYSSAIDKSKMVVIRNGIVAEDYMDQGSQTCASNVIKHPAIGVVGRLVQWKGQETLIRSVPLVTRQFKDATFYIVGADPSGNRGYESYLKSLAMTLGCSEQIVFTGWVDDPRSIFKNLDLCVCTSLKPEPFGLVILESMISGTPVISTRCGGPLDLINEGMDGFLYHPGNHIELAKLIIDILSNLELSASVAKAAQNKALTVYSICKVVQEIEQQYDCSLQVTAIR